MRYRPKEHPRFPGWFTTLDYPMFAANRDGAIKNLLTGNVTFGSKDDRGYRRVALWDNVTKKKKEFKAHRIVCSAFHGPWVEGMEVGHEDDVRDNNKPSNLRWVTRKENMDKVFGRLSLEWGINDRLSLESSNEVLIPTYIVFMHTGTVFSKISKWWSGSKWGHVSIADDPNMTTLRTFSVRKNYGALLEERAKMKGVEYRKYAVWLTPEEAERFKVGVDYLFTKKDSSYSMQSIVSYILGLPSLNFKKQDLICSEFVRRAFALAGINLIDDVNIASPVDLLRSDKLEFVEEGTF